MTKEELILELRAYIDQISIVQSYFTAYMTLCDCIKHYNKKINIAPGFFSIVKNALINSMCMCLAKLYSSGREEKTLTKLFNQIDANRNLFPSHIENEYSWGFANIKEQYKEETDINIGEEVNKARIKLKEFEPIINNLKGRRDKYLAHNDKEYFSDSYALAIDFPLDTYGVRKLIEFAGDFCVQMLVYLSGTVYPYHIIGSDDLDFLLQSIK